MLINFKAYINQDRISGGSPKMSASSFSKGGEQAQLVLKMLDK